MNDTVGTQRAWARVAGLMYLVTLVVDIGGIRVDSAAMSRALLFAGAWCVIPLALGLFGALRPFAAAAAGWALSFRLLEAALGVLTITVEVAGVHARLAGSRLGMGVLEFAHWASAAELSAFIFTIGSTIFFFLFLRSGYIPRVLAGWGLFSSVLSFGTCGMHLVRPALPAMTMTAWVPMLIAEVSTGLWLLIKAVRVKSSRTAVTEPALRAG